MSETQDVLADKPVWKDEGSSRIPFWAYTDESIYRRELDRIFYHGLLIRN